MSTAASQPSTSALVFFGVGIIAASIILSTVLSWTAVALLTILTILFAIALVRPVWVVYTLAFIAPMGGLAIDFSRDPSFSQIPVLGSINAPLIDLIAIGALLICGVLFLFRSNENVIDFSPLKTFRKPFALFFIAVALAVYFGDRVFFGIAIKSFFRPYLFTVVAFALPVMLLVKTRVQLLRTLFAYECAAVLGALMGLVSLVTQPAIVFARAVPFSIFGFTPFGVNHNVLGESLVPIIPFAWWFAAQQKTEGRRILFVGSAAFISIISLLTFSRAAWIAIAIQLVLFGVWHAQKHRAHIRAFLKTYIVAAAATVFAIATFFIWIQSTVIADSSDNTRKDLLGIAITYWQRAPWFGQGPGTYVPLVEETVAFRMDYGAAMDAHGVIQKLLLETGSVGLATFIIAVGSVMGYLWFRKKSELHFLLLTILLSAWGYQLFNTGYFDGKVWVLMGLAMVSVLL